MRKLRLLCGPVDKNAYCSGGKRNSKCDFWRQGIGTFPEIRGYLQQCATQSGLFEVQWWSSTGNQGLYQDASLSYRSDTYWQEQPRLSRYSAWWAAGDSYRRGQAFRLFLWTGTDASASLFADKSRAQCLAKGRKRSDYTYIEFGKTDWPRTDSNVGLSFSLLRWQGGRWKRDSRFCHSFTGFLRNDGSGEGKCSCHQPFYQRSWYECDIGKEVKSTSGYYHYQYRAFSFTDKQAPGIPPGSGS